MLIAPAAQRMKAGHDIVVNRSPAQGPPGRPSLSGSTRSGGAACRCYVCPGTKLFRPSWRCASWSASRRRRRAGRGPRQRSSLVPGVSLDRSGATARPSGIPVQTLHPTIPPTSGGCARPRVWSTGSGPDPAPQSGSPTSPAGWTDSRDGPWWSLLREGLEDLFHELGDREADRKDVIEWLAEWGRDARKRQTGLLLLSAHRAKGLEFDDVVILDGDWDRSSNGEDGDSERRLYYVAMTRARRSLALLSMGARHPFIDGLEGPAVAYRAPGCERPSTLANTKKDLSDAQPLGGRPGLCGAAGQRSSGAPVPGPDRRRRFRSPEAERRPLVDRRPR